MQKWREISKTWKKRHNLSLKDEESKKEDEDVQMQKRVDLKMDKK